MNDGLSPNTSASLLDRLRSAPNDQEAWSEFVDRYAPQLYDWCKHWQLQDADAYDVTQAVLIRLLRRLRVFRYDRQLSFRKWLRTVARHAWYDFLADRKKAATVGQLGQEQLAAVSARDDLFARLDAEFDRELVEEAKAKVRLRVEPRTWKAFHLTAVELLSAAEAGDQLHMSVAAVFKAKSVVLKMLREEIAKLDGREPVSEEG